jgi:hypothetical protein
MISRLHPDVDIDDICFHSSAIEEAVEQAGREARLKHKQLGVPIVVWQDGKIVEIPPEEIVVDLPQAPEDKPSDL